MSVPSDSRVAADVPADVDKRLLYAEWLRNSRWRDKLHKKAAHKALDMPEEEMSVSVRQGMTWKELAVIGAMLLGTGGLGLFFARPQPAAENAADSEYDVRFFDADGRPIDVRPLSEKKE